MTVFLKANVSGLGKAGDKVNVSDGYARNYLIPKGLAFEANAQAEYEYKTKTAAEKNKADNEMAKAKALAEKLKTVKIVIEMPSGANGKLYGSVTSAKIADEIFAQAHITVDKKRLVLDDNMKTYGEYDVEVKVYPGVTSKLKVSIKPKED